MWFKSCAPVLVVNKRAHAGGQYGGGGRYGEGGEGGGYGAGRQLHCRALELRLKDKASFVSVCFMGHGHEGFTPRVNDDDAGSAQDALFCRWRARRRARRLWRQIWYGYGHCLYSSCLLQQYHA